MLDDLVELNFGRHHLMHERDSLFVEFLFNKMLEWAFPFLVH